MSDNTAEQVPNVSDDAVTGLAHDPVQGARISEHDPVETVDHPHNTSVDTAGEPADADDDGVQEHPGTGEVSQGTEVPVGQGGTLDAQGSGQEGTAPVEGTGTPPEGSEAVTDAPTDAPAGAEGTVDAGNTQDTPPTE